jgi:hypothetical protein
VSADSELISETERWFVRQGLPFFVECRRLTIDDLARGRSLVVLVAVYFGSLVIAVPTDLPWPERLLFAGIGLVVLVAVWAAANLARRHSALERPSRVGLVEVGVFVLGPAAAVAVLRRDADLVLTVLLADLTVLGVVAAAEVLDAAPIVRWAIGRTFRELGSLFRLVTRALPMLLLFTTFLFINTEVWQVASSLSPPVLWLAVAFFGVLAVGFLLARLPEELTRVTNEINVEFVRRAVLATPLEPLAAQLPEDLHAEPLAGKQRKNLLLVLLVTQLSQVLLLALSVWLFFLAFGTVAIEDDVIASWVGQGAPHRVPVLAAAGLSRELLQVSIFLAAFSGLYFTVYAITDGDYRDQFFTEITDELDRATGVRVAYLALRRRAPHS